MKNKKLFIAIIVAIMIVMIVPALCFADDTLTGWQTMDTGTYYYDDAGIPVTGTQIIGGSSYYFDKSGIMQTGRQTIAGKDYYYGTNGVMQVGWQTINGSKFYFYKSTSSVHKRGEMATGFSTILNKTYYFYKTGTANHPKGAMATGLNTLNNSKYYFAKSSGLMATGWWEISGSKYYFYKSKTSSHAKGAAAKGWINIDNRKYYMNTSSCKMMKGLVSIKGSKYYFYKSTSKTHKKGQMAKGWMTVTGNKYYFSNSTGRAYKGLYKIGNTACTFNDNGVLKRKIYGDKKMIALTYDDGPSSNTPTILSTLKKYNSLATFFVVGNRVPAYSSYAKQAVEMGCQIGNHSYSHPWYSQMTAAQIKREISNCNNNVKGYTGKSPVVCRTPGGELGSKITSSVGMPIILWSVDTRDWATQSSSSTYSAVMSGAKDGAVVLMHDLYSSTATATQRIVPALRSQGYQLVTIKEMSMLRTSNGLAKGKVYYSFGK